ncbi:B3/4 domain-containing protein [Nocardia sp. NPDC058176]|uniref:B3/B4 domain-containing protein n=1 Tax=Nocardia sp. NPDC058176 TaxID=3346368 RepID=UPI0036DE9D22
MDTSVFDLQPDFRRGVVVARKVRNDPSAPGLVRRLRAAEQQVRGSLDIATLAQIAQIVDWRSAFKSFGADPGKFRAAGEALIRRTLAGNPLPAISTVVDIGTVLSLRHLVPCGAHSLDDVKRELLLTRAVGDETFVPFTKEGTVEHPEAGEVVFVDDSQVATRRWAWRQGAHTIIRPETENFELNIDCLGSTTDNQLRAAMSEAVDLIREFCGAPDISTGVLDKNNPTFTVQ